MIVKKLHHYCALLMVAFWLVQALTGIAIVFRWEIDDALLAGKRVPVDAAALGQRIEALGRNGKVGSMWASSAAADRFDIYYADAAGADRVMRVDGAGKVLRDSQDGAMLRDGGIFNTLTSIHASLLSGATGEWIVGISGVLLLLNVILGLRLGWPRKGSVRRSMLARPSGSEQARRYGWHRLIGLWVAVPMLLVAAVGVLLVFDDGIEEMLGTALPVPAAERAAQNVIGHSIAPGQALQTALAGYPGASISALSMPEEGEPWFKVRVRVPGELPANWGKTTLFIATSGQVLAAHDARLAPRARSFVDALYSIHTGQFAEFPGRIFLVAVAAAFMALMIMGLRLWWLRRR